MHLHRGSALFTFSLTLALATLAGPGQARAAVADCMSAFGTCEVSNDGFDWVDCTCIDGSGGGGGGGNMWAGLTELELAPICEEQLTSFCGPFVPPEFLECWGLFGSCTIDNDPEDSLACECYDGSTTGFSGGMVWAGFSDLQLSNECEAQLDAACLPPPMSLQCSNANGECTVANVPSDFLGCECLDDSAAVLSGGNAWAGWSELQLLTECGTQLVGFCGGPLPPPPWLECSSTLGECIIDNDPDMLECTCADGERISSGGGSEWAGLSDEELFMECEEQLYEGCSVGAESGSSSGDSGDSGDTGGSSTTGSGSSTGEPGADTGVDESGGPSESSSGGPPPPATTGDDTTSGSESSDGGATGDGDGGCGCSAKDGSKPGGWALALLGLVGVAWRRRRPARAVS